MTEQAMVHSFRRIARRIHVNTIILVMCTVQVISGALQASIPAGYYDRAEGITGSALKDSLHLIIKGHTEYPYTSDNPDVWDGIQDVDEDTNNTNNVILLYTGRSQEKDYLDHGYDWDYSQYDGGNGTYDNAWNREHVWAKSHGDFGTTNGAGTDLHHLRPADRTVNSTRNNLDFDDGGSQHSEATECYYDSDSWEPRDAVKGDIARMIFYMATRYEGEGDEPDLEVVDFVYNWTVNDSSRPYHGKLSTLQQWHQDDPVDNWERLRNDKIYTNWQHNRNPFIDHPEYVALIDWSFDTSGSSGSSNPDEPTTLSAGDIVIIGINCDDPDDFAFVPLVDLNTGTVINFTDNGWLSSGAFRTGEGIKTYTAPGIITAGTIIVYSENSSNFTSSGSLLFSVSGDQLIAYQGSFDSPTMLYAVNIKGAAVWQSDAADPNTSALPAGLTNGTNCVAVTEKDNIKYDGSVTSGKAEVLAAVSDNANWIGDDATRYDFTTTQDYSLPVELANFSLECRSNGVVLTWTTESETENLGFIIQRKSAGANHDSPSLWSQIATYIDDKSLTGHGSTSERHEYSYTDALIIPGTSYAYRLGDVDYSGAVTWHATREITTQPNTVPVVSGFSLQKAFPNPFNPETTLRFELGEAANFSVRVYDLRGNLVTTLTDSPHAAGIYSLHWNGTNSHNQPVSTGIYLVLAETNSGFLHTEKVILIR